MLVQHLLLGERFLMSSQSRDSCRLMSSQCQCKGVNILQRNGISKIMTLLVRHRIPCVTLCGGNSGLSMHPIKLSCFNYSSFRLTLVLSCAMNFKNYPHDTQVCNLKIESSKYQVKLIRTELWKYFLYFYPELCILHTACLAF